MTWARVVTHRLTVRDANPVLMAGDSHVGEDWLGGGGGTGTRTISSRGPTCACAVAGLALSLWRLLRLCRLLLRP